MIMPFEIQAHVGVGPVRLGMTRAEVRDALAAYPSHGLNQTLFNHPSNHPTSRA